MMQPKPHALRWYRSVTNALSVLYPNANAGPIAPGFAIFTKRKPKH